MSKNENNKYEKKSFIKFMIICVIAFFIGIGISVIMNIAKNLGVDFSVITNGIASVLQPGAPILFVALNVICFVTALCMFLNTKKKAVKWDGEDEDVIDLIEKQLNYPLGIANAMLIINMFLFAANIQVVEYSAFGEKYEDIIFPVIFITFMLGLVWTMGIINMVVKVEKQLNPEKRGSIFDMNFQKVWTDSCDEAQMLIVYKAAYKAFSVTNGVCMALWMITILIQMYANIGILPNLCVCIIWLVSVITYTVVCTKLESAK